MGTLARSCSSSSFIPNEGAHLPGGQLGDPSGWVAAAQTPAGPRRARFFVHRPLCQGKYRPGIEAPGVFDGFNIDWEFPGPGDKENFTSTEGIPRPTERLVEDDGEEICPILRFSRVCEELRQHRFEGSSRASGLSHDRRI